MKKVKAIIERAADGTFSVYMNDDALEYAINGQGDTVEKAVADFRAVYEEMIAFLKAEGNGCTEVEFEFEYDVVSFLKYYESLPGKHSRSRAPALGARKRATLSKKKHSHCPVKRGKGG